MKQYRARVLSSWRVSIAALFALAFYLSFHQASGMLNISNDPSHAHTAALPRETEQLRTSEAQLPLSADETQFLPGKAAEEPPHSKVALAHRRSASPRFVESYGRLPLAFEANRGQTDAKVKFLSRGHGYTMFLTGDAAVLALRTANQKAKGKGERPKMEGNARALLPSPVWLLKDTTNNKQPTKNGFSIDNSPAPAVLRMILAGASPKSKVVGLDELPGKSNYLIGNDPKKWRTNVANYAKVKYESVYPGVDLVYYGNQRQLEYDFIVAPGANPRAIALEIVGAGGVRPMQGEPRSPIQIDPNGNLVIPTSSGDVRFHKPVVYQQQAVLNSRRLRVREITKQLTRDNGRLTTGAFNHQSSIDNRQFVDGRFVLLAEDRIGFEIGAYDRAQPLIIDPVLSYSTYLGGSDNEAAADIAVDASGNAYVTGGTLSADFPKVTGSFDTGCGTDGSCDAAQGDVFVTKINAAGNALVYSTFLGGSDTEAGSGIVVDSSGNAYVTGGTASSNFPTTAGSFDTSCGTDGLCNSSQADAFVTKLNATGSALVYSTYLGGSDNDVAADIAVDAAGNAYVTGGTLSADFPKVAALQGTFAGGINAGDAFVTKLNAAGNALVYSTYLGGSGDDAGVGIALDSSGSAYVAGATGSSNFPTANPIQPTLNGDSDAFVAKLNAAGSALSFSSYLGGAGGEAASGIAVDSEGHPYVTGGTDSVDFPTVNPIQANIAGGGDSFVSKILAADFSLSLAAGTQGTATITAGQTATYTLTLASQAFQGTVQLSCSGAPQAATCAVSSDSVAMNANDSVNVTVNVQTTARSMLVPLPEPRSGLPWLPWLVSLVILACVAGAMRRRCSGLALGAALLFVVLWSSCNGKAPPKGGGGTPPGTYPLTVSATSQGLTREVPLNLTVK